MFCGILVRMFTGKREHPSAHIHVVYGNYSATFDILTAERIEGGLPLRQSRLVVVWMELHREELLADWDLAKAGETLLNIDPLK
ncbi:MAG: DUF4160 domain-containing protein [Spirochaetota bacterium]